MKITAPTANQAPDAARIAQLFEAATTPGSFLEWCDRLDAPEAEAMRQEYRALVVEECDRLVMDSTSEVEAELHHGAQQSILRRVKAALPEDVRDDLERLHEGLLVHAEARAEVSFRVGVAIGRILGRRS